MLEACSDAATQMNRYPDMGVTALQPALAERLGVPAEHVATGTGSVGVLYQLVQATCDPGDEVVYAWRSFEAYPIVGRRSPARRRCRCRSTPTRRHDLDAMAAAITDRTTVVLVCTPNNPTGPAVHQRRARRVPRPGAPATCWSSSTRPTVEFVTRPARRPTRSRLYRAAAQRRGAAHLLQGLRAGRPAGRATPSRTSRSRAALRKTAVPFGVSDDRPGGRRRVASRRTDELLERVDALVAERDRVVGGAARSRAGRVPQTEANFVWFAAGRPTRRLRGGCGRGRARRAAVRRRRACACTIGETEANDLLIDVAGRFRQGGRPLNRPGAVGTATHGASD